MKHWLSLFVLFTLLAATNPAAGQNEAAASYPSKPIRMMVGFSAGGAGDVIARIIGKDLGDALKRPVVIENKPGADGRIAAETVAKSPPDGYTVLLAAENMFTLIPFLYPNSGVDATRDFDTVVTVAGAPLVLAAAKDLPANTLPELIALAKAKPGEISYGTSGSASMHFVMGENLSRLTDIKLLHVPFKGTSQAAQALAGGQVQLAFASLPSIQPLVKSGKAKIIAVTSEKRFSMLPNTPSIAETVKGWADFGIWFGILVPKGTPPEIIDKLNRETVKALATSDVRDRIHDVGFVPVGGSPEQYRALMQRAAETTGRVIKAAGIKAE